MSIWVGSHSEVSRKLDGVLKQLPLLKYKVTINFSEGHVFHRRAELVVWVGGWVGELRIQVWQEWRYTYPTSKEQMNEIVDTLYYYLLPLHAELELLK